MKFTEPSQSVEYDIDALINGINADNSHEEANFGAPVGKEALPKLLNQLMNLNSKIYVAGHRGMGGFGHHAGQSIIAQQVTSC